MILLNWCAFSPTAIWAPKRKSYFYEYSKMQRLCPLFITLMSINFKQLHIVKNPWIVFVIENKRYKNARGNMTCNRAQSTLQFQSIEIRCWWVQSSSIRTVYGMTLNKKRKPASPPFRRPTIDWRSIVWSVPNRVDFFNALAVVQNRNALLASPVGYLKFSAANLACNKIGCLSDFQCIYRLNKDTHSVNLRLQRN